MSFYFPDQKTTNPVIGSRNRIINGAMRIDQRNVGAAVTVASAATLYVTDRFYCYNGLNNAVTFQQTVLGAANLPPKIPASPQHTNCLYFKNNATAATATNSTVQILQGIEGYNLTDLQWGTTLAKTVTFQFWVYCSVTGPFSITILGASNYVASYTITTANTWQFVTITIPGATTGAWNNDTSAGITLNWNLHGSTSGGSTSNLNTWTSNGFQASTQTNLGLTASSVFAITGAQFEMGTIATSFEWRPWDVELLRCQRYYEKSTQYSNPPLQNGSNGALYKPAAAAGSGGNFIEGPRYLTEKRVLPTFRLWSPDNATLGSVQLQNTTTLVAATTGNPGLKGVGVLSPTAGPYTAGSMYLYHWDASADF